VKPSIFCKVFTDLSITKAAASASSSSSAAAASSTSKSSAGMLNAKCGLLATIVMVGAGILMF
jgi:hypothetical protein